MSLPERLCRAALILLGLSASLGAVSYKTPQSDRLGEVRGRVAPSLRQELASAGFSLGDPAFIRIFKEERELELWLKPENETQFKLWKTWPIAAMSGRLGPKQKEGDQQAPEGFYETDVKSMNPNSKYHLSFNVGYPNALDRFHQRTGALIMVHGKAVSIGCFAMTDPVIEQIYLIVEEALHHGQSTVPIHSFPFRMTDERMTQAAAERSPWLPFWEDIRTAYLRFDASRDPPAVQIHAGRYQCCDP